MLSRFLLVALSALALGPVHAADAYPDRPVRIVVGQAAGGGMDTLARLLSEQMGESLGKPVVVENKSGAGGVIGTEFVAKADPDGYTLMLAPIGNMVFTTILTPNLRYSPQKDFTPVAMLATFPLVLLVKSDLPVATLPELVEYLRKHPDRANYGGSGPAFQFASEMFKLRAKVPGEFIQYRSMGETITAIASGDLAMALVDTGPAISGLAGGKVKALAVTSPQRLAALPGVPTVTELGLPELEIEYWAGLFAPAKTPPAVVKRLEGDAAKALRNARVAERMKGLNMVPGAGGAEQLARALDTDLRKWSDVARSANIQAAR